MSYPVQFKNKAVKLRKLGYSIKEVANKLKIAKSTSSLWLRDILLDKNAQKRLGRQKIIGQYKAIQIAKRKRIRKNKLLSKKASLTLSRIQKSKSLNKLLLAFLFWTEGGKSSDSFVFFINSDPTMVAVFVKLMRKSFNLDENKFRAMVHIHEYHNESEIIFYWSKITKIPTSQFSKSYKKPHTGKRKRDNYQGSIRIRYYDSKIAQELRSLYNTYADSLGP